MNESSRNSTHAADSCRTCGGGAFRALNSLTTPLVHLGLGSLRPPLAGLTVLETQGRVSGKLHETPLLALSLGDSLVVTTFRGRQSQWVKNALANPEVNYWFDGRPHPARAAVFSPNGRAPDTVALESPLNLLVPHFALWIQAGWAFAVLSPPSATP